jgi:hypothetical protein
MFEKQRVCLEREQRLSKFEREQQLSKFRLSQIANLTKLEFE